MVISVEYLKKRATNVSHLGKFRPFFCRKKNLVIFKDFCPKESIFCLISTKVLASKALNHFKIIIGHISKTNKDN